MAWGISAIDDYKFVDGTPDKKDGMAIENLNDSTPTATKKMLADLGITEL